MTMKTFDRYAYTRMVVEMMRNEGERPMTEVDTDFIATLIKPVVDAVEAALRDAIAHGRYRRSSLPGLQFSDGHLLVICDACDACSRERSMWPLRELKIAPDGRSFCCPSAGHKLDLDPLFSRRARDAV